MKTNLKLIFVLLAHTTILMTAVYAQNNDCSNSFLICDKKSYQFDAMSGLGLKDFEEIKPSCSPHLTETNSLWLKWQVEKSGTLTFVIEPNFENDDIDFILFSNSCRALQEVRCMAAGEIIGRDPNRSINCKGKTGLNYESIDEFEKSGCKYNSDNFLKYVSVNSGETYYLFINNYDKTNGVQVTFDGTAILKNNCEIVSSISEELTGKISLKPNPTSKNINIQLEMKLNGNYTFDVLSSEGKKLKTSAHQLKTGLNDIQIDLVGLNPGMYYVKISDGVRSIFKPIIKI